MRPVAGATPMLPKNGTSGISMPSESEKWPIMRPDFKCRIDHKAATTIAQ